VKGCVANFIYGRDEHLRMTRLTRRGHRTAALDAICFWPPDWPFRIIFMSSIPESVVATQLIYRSRFVFGLGADVAGEEVDYILHSQHGPPCVSGYFDFEFRFHVESQCRRIIGQQS
jgi:hypothetical protein